MGVDIPRTGLESLMSSSSRRAGGCVAGSTRLAWWTGERTIAVVRRQTVGHDEDEKGVIKGTRSNQRAESEVDEKGRCDKGDSD